jgi:hypothetical protein
MEASHRGRRCSAEEKVKAGMTAQDIREGWAAVLSVIFTGVQRERAAGTSSTLASRLGNARPLSRRGPPHSGEPLANPFPRRAGVAAFTICVSLGDPASSRPASAPFSSWPPTPIPPLAANGRRSEADPRTRFRRNGAALVPARLDRRRYPAGKKASAKEAR